MKTGSALKLHLGPGLRRDERIGGKGVAFYTYILASRRNGTLYTGSTDNLAKRVHQHKSAEIPGFTAKYGVHLLVWFEAHETREAAFRQERRIKEWRRAWKLRLIEERNPEWRDLSCDLNNLLTFT